MGEVINRHPSSSIEEEKKARRRKIIKQLPIKKFEIRDSLIAQLCEQNPHIRVVKHIFAAALIGLFINTVIHGFSERGELNLGLNVIATGLAKFHWVPPIWITLNGCIILCYFGFNVWARIRINMPLKSPNKKLWDSIWLLSLAAYYILQFRVISVVVTVLKLPIATSSVVCLEQTRLLMKIHAFVRTSAEKVINFKPHSDQKLNLASFKHFLYFLFAPTLVYCDEYPRRKSIRWNLVFEKTLELVGVIFYYAFLVERFIIPNLKDMGLRSYTIRELGMMAFDNFAVGLMFLLLAFYVVIDAAQNLVGELLRFGDRQFYLDWWTATNYSDYFRMWNMVVGDWLYTYIYKDFYESIVPGSKTVAKLTVFLISAIVHEWVLTYIFGFFFPALFLAFCFVGGCLSFLRIPKLDIVNIIFWYMLAFGCGLLSSLYAMEWFIRANVPIENATLSDFLVPRLFTCDCIVY
ncbi:unnamed protein product [Ceutorhynchus assimilis]|uniref:O-acyltransferase n=1 Tax=Ceutorhynchus assimilis TaxID=467358 RepID=A0A9N9QJF7_9CUCU|nr:unnamed protein product [Ceutorhynchus assimilis]